MLLRDNDSRDSDGGSDDSDSGAEGGGGSKKKSKRRGPPALVPCRKAETGDKCLCLFFLGEDTRLYSSYWDQFLFLQTSQAGSILSTTYKLTEDTYKPSGMKKMNVRHALLPYGDKVVSLIMQFAIFGKPTAPGTALPNPRNYDWDTIVSLHFFFLCRRLF